MRKKSFLYWLNEVCAWSGSAMFLILTAICFMQVICRYLFNNAQDWPEELSRFLFIWIAWLGMAYSMYCRAHLKVDALLLLVSRKWFKIIEAVSYAITLIFMAFVAYEGINMLDIVIESEEEALTLPIPLWIVWFSIPFTFGISSIYCIANIYKMFYGPVDTIEAERAREVEQ